jgi:hypothetical protein
VPLVILFFFLFFSLLLLFFLFQLIFLLLSYFSLFLFLLSLASYFRLLIVEALVLQPSILFFHPLVPTKALVLQPILPIFIFLFPPPFHPFLFLGDPFTTCVFMARYTSHSKNKFVIRYFPPIEFLSLSYLIPVWPPVFAYFAVLINNVQWIMHVEFFLPVMERS